MGSKFLDTDGDTDLSSLQNGTFDAYLGSVRVDDTTPNQMLRMNADKKLVSTLVEQSDLNFSVLTNPNNSNLISDGLEVTSGNVLKTDTIRPTSGVDIDLDTPTGATISRVLKVTTISNNNVTPGTSINVDRNFNMTGNNITNSTSITADNLTANTTATLNTTTMTGNLDVAENSILRVNQADIASIVPSGGTTLGIGANILMTDVTNKDITNVGALKCGALTCLTLNTEEKSNRITSNANLRMLNNDITEVDQIDVDNITSITNPQVNVLKNLDMNANSVVGANDLQTASISALTSTVSFQDNVSLASNNITNVGTLTSTNLNSGNINITGNTISSTDLLEFISGNTARINFKSDSGILSLENANLGNSVNIELAQFGGTNFNIIKQTGNIDFCAEGADTVELTTDCFGTNKKVILNPTAGATGTVQLRDYDLDMNNKNIDNVVDITASRVKTAIIEPPVSAIINTSGSNFINASAYRGTLLDINEINDLSSNGVSVTAEFKMNSNDITNVRSMSITATQYISRVEDMGTPVGNYYVIPDNTTWIILGQITLQYGIEFGVNCSLRGIDFSAQITFDESVRDCDIKAVDNNLYLSQLTIVNGGGRFTGTPASVRGLLNATNYNVGAPAPFYGRNKRFKVTDCNILRPFKIGTVEGFGTLNVTNNFFNGGGGLAGQATSYYTNEGLSVSDGLSLELNNNKMVLMLGAQQVSTLKLLNMKARVSPLLGFNAVTITGNIFHPRSTETGVDFDADSRTQLGNISGNVFIRTGGTSPLINYTDQTTYDNYNPLSIENYSINANTGVVDSEPNLKSGVGASASISSATATLLEPSDNNQIEVINLSSRFGVQLDLTGVTTAFVANERITDTASGSTALILAVDAEAGGLQSVYITDMSGKFSATPTTFTSTTGSATGGSLRYIYRYSEKDPRKLVLTATFSVSVGNNKEYFIAPSMGGMADTICESGGVSTNTGAGATVSITCSKKYSEGDTERFFFRTSDASAGNITKGIIIIK